VNGGRAEKPSQAAFSEKPLRLDVLQEPFRVLYHPTIIVESPKTLCGRTVSWKRFRVG
jgi:hypothetical protein